MEEVNKCNCCGSIDLTFCYKQPDTLYHQNEWFAIFECRNCGLGFVNPRPSNKELDKYYPEIFFESFKQDEQHKKRYRRQAAFLPTIDINCASKKLLDIGCAKGDFPRFMRKLGWDVEGIEVSSNVKTEEDFIIHRKPLNKLNLPSENYDAITAWAVFEHLHDPKSYFEEVSRILKKNGRFVFLVTNFESLSSRYLFREDIPRHLHFFSEKSIFKYISSAGLELTSKVSNNKIYEMMPSNILYYIGMKLRGKKLTWDNIPENMTSYFIRNNIKPKMKNKLKYFIFRPFISIDRIVAVLYSRIQILRGTYGIVTYTAIKR